MIARRGSWIMQMRSDVATMTEMTLWYSWGTKESL